MTTIDRLLAETSGHNTCPTREKGQRGTAGVISVGTVQYRTLYVKEVPRSVTHWVLNGWTLVSKSKSFLSTCMPMGIWKVT